MSSAKRRALSGSWDEAIDGEFSPPGSIPPRHEDTPIPVDVEEGIDVELSDEQRNKMLRKAKVSGEARSAARLEAEYALREAGRRIGYDPKENLLKVQIAPRIEDAMVDPDGWRMIVHDIVVEDFKSYKGRQQLGPLHKNLTMIVGPNGNGKSNVIDALLFVFGFKGKTIRSPKLSSLINDQGSDSCRVEVHFLEIKDLDEEKYKISTKNKLVVARSINKREHSYYYINGQIRTAKDVFATLRRIGIDLSHNRFLILQGEVEQIAQMPPTSTDPNQDGMLEYIEDIVGTNRFKPVIEKLKHACMVIDLNSSQAAANARQHSRVSASFEPNVNSSVIYVNNVNNATYNKLMIAHYCLRGARSEKHEIEKTLADVTDLLEEAREKENESRQTLDDKMCEEKEKEREYRECQKEKIRLDHENNQLHLKRDRARVNEQNAKAELEKILIEVEEHQTSLDALIEAPGPANLIVNNLRVERDQLRTTKEECERLEAENQKKFDEKAAGPQQKIKDAEAKLAEVGDPYRTAKKKFELTKDELEQLREDLLVPERLKEEMSKKDEAQKELKTLQDVGSVSSAIAQTEEKIAFKKKKGETITKYLEELEDKRYTMMTELKRINAADRDNKNQSQLHKELVEMMKAGTLNNYVGRLGDLASIDNKYLPAISTVFSTVLDYFVMDTANDSVAAIELITKHKLGRANFYSLDRLDKRNDVRMNAPKSRFPAPRLFDQIKGPDDDKKDVTRRCYYQFLGDILVCKNITEAQSLYKKCIKKNKYFRFCTLDGTVLEKNGNITGGSMVTGKMRATGADPLGDCDQEKKTFVQKLINDHEQALEEIKKKEEMLSENNVEIAEEERELKQLIKQKEELIEQKEDLEWAHHYASNKITTYKKRLETLDAPDVIASKIVITDRTLGELKKQLKIHEKAMREAESQVTRCTELVEKMYNPLVAKFKEETKKVTERLNVLEGDIAQQESLINLIPGRIMNATAQLDDAKERCEQKKKEMEEYAAEGANTKSIVQQQADLLTQLTTVEKECRDMKEAVDKITAERKKADEDYKKKHQVTEEFEEAYLEVRRLSDDRQHKEDMAQNEISRLEDSWMQFEDLDPSTTFVRYNDPEFHDKFHGSDALLMPQEMLVRWEDYPSSYEDVIKVFRDDILPFSTLKLAELQNNTVELDAQAEAFRRKQDDKAITQYCTLVSLRYGEETTARKNNRKAIAYRKKLAELKQARLSEFMEALTFLGSTTQMLYQMITNGGDASLKFMEGGKSSDPFDGGISFNVRPAKKKWNVIKHLSGGEKTLASLCFVFAMHHFRATPLYVMDEIDAALDQINVRLIANYIRFSEKTRNAQFLIISLRNQMFELAPRLIGIYKVDGVTKNFVVNPEGVEESKRWGCALLEEKRRETNRKAKASQVAELAQDMRSMTIGVKRPIKRPRRMLSFPQMTEILESGDESDEEKEPESMAYGSVPRIPGMRIADEVVIEEDNDSSRPVPSQRPPATKRRKLLPTVREASPSESFEQMRIGEALSLEEDPVRTRAVATFMEDSRSQMPPLNSNDDEGEDEVFQSGQTTPRPESVHSGSYNFDEEGDEPVKLKPKRVVDDSSDIETPSQSRTSAESSSSSHSVSPSRSPGYSGPSTLTGERSTVSQ